MSKTINWYPIFVDQTAQSVLFYCIKSGTERIGMVCGLNESLKHVDEEFDPYLQKKIALQKSVQSVDVLTTCMPGGGGAAMPPELQNTCQ